MTNQVHLLSHYSLERRGKNLTLFFEDEIDKVKRTTDRQGFRDLLLQDPRTQEGWSSRNSSVFSQRFTRETENQEDSWWDKD